MSYLCSPSQFRPLVLSMFWFHVFMSAGDGSRFVFHQMHGQKGEVRGAYDCKYPCISILTHWWRGCSLLLFGDMNVHGNLGFML